MRLSLLVPTFRRPAPLERALRSLLAQEGLLDGALGSCELLVIDNDPEGSARETVMALREEATPMDVRYILETTPGVAAARNRAFAEAKGALLVLLDDDQMAEPSFLKNLIGALERFNGDFAFSAIEALFEGPPPVAASAWERLFSRLYPEGEGVLPKKHRPTLSTGGVVLRAASVRAVFGTSPPFDMALGQIGGEDTAFFRTMHAAGKKSIWAPSARISEFIPESRTTLPFLLERRFANGQLRTRMHLRDGVKGPFGAAVMMGLGAGQASVAGAQWGAAKILKNKQQETDALAAFAAGIGKVLWPIQLKRYGNSSKKKS